MATTLTPLETQSIKRLLLIGLACHGQLEELRREADMADALGLPWPDDAVPVDRIGDSRITSKFLLALSLLETPLVR